jgi:type III secretion protein L
MDKNTFPHSTVTGRVLKSSHVDSELGIVQRHAEAGHILDSARKAASEMLAAAQEKGLNEGRNAILNSTLEEVQRVGAEFSALVNERQDEIVDVVMEAVAKIIGKIPVREQAHMILSTALADMLDSFTVVLKVSAEDLGMVRDVLTQLQAQQQGQNVISVLVDPLLSSGEMLLETERGRVHIGLAQQMARLRAGFIQAAQTRS